MDNIITSVLILGNGFDLDLGLKTRYSDFAKSKEWDELYHIMKWSVSGLGHYLEKKSKEDNWFDIEESIAKYVKEKEQRNDFQNVYEDKCYFEILKRKLASYVDSFEVWETIKDNSLAAKIMEIDDTYKCFAKIYSFNYTNYEIATIYNENIHPILKKEYVHNSGNNIVLGVGEQDCISTEYSFLKKVNQNIAPANLLVDLIDANEVIFFGHSINRYDMQYFRRYFDICSQEYNRLPKRHITFITKNEDSIIMIKDNLAYAITSVTDFQMSCQVEFISTEDYYGKTNEVENCVHHLLNRLLNNTL